MTLIISIVALLVWFVSWWCNYVKSDEVALRRFFGRLGRKICKSGLVCVPLFPGIDLVRIPTRQIPFRFEGKLEHRVWSKDHQPLLVDISGYVRFPFDDIGSLHLMIRSGVPFIREELENWMEEEIISGLRDIMAGFNHDEAISRSNLAAVQRDAKKFFLKKNGLFYKSGICGENPLDFTAGTGEVIVRVEQVNPTSELQKAMQDPVVAKYEADAAKETARMNAEQVGAQVLGTVAKQHGLTLDELAADLKANPKKISISVKDGGYAETFIWAQDQVRRDRAAAAGELTDIRVGSTDGTAFKDKTFGLLLGGLAAAARKFAQGGGGQGKRGGKGKGKKPKEMTDGEALESALED